VPGQRRQVARAAAFVGHLVLLAHAERESRVVVEEERGDVVVVDHEQHVGLALRQPARTGAKASKMGAQTGSSCLFLSKAKPMVGVCEQAMAPMMRP
jgi:hypothetical protein